MLLGAIVESVTHKSYAEVVQTEILDPAGMTNTTYLDFKKLIPQKATDYIREDGQIVHRIQAAFADGNGASGLVSTVEDLLLWDSALQSNLLLSQQYQDELFKPQVTKYAPYYYGYGWFLADLTINDRLTRVEYHSGGGSCFIMRNVAEGHTIILLNNIRSDNLYDISLELLTAIQSDQ
jgi:CubicO group peptidase (beta-lactamase class C family)